jgi:hypothetical protein
MPPPAKVPIEGLQETDCCSYTDISVHAVHLNGIAIFLDNGPTTDEDHLEGKER